MRKTPLVSILVANYNNGKFFKDCYKSIIEQTYNNWEVIIVDDKSTDDSISTIKKIIKEDNRFKLYENAENKGCGYTKNRCVKLCEGEICLFLDPDDTITKDALQLMVKEHEIYPNASLVYSNMYICDENLNIIKETEKTQCMQNDPFFLNMKGTISHLCSFKKSFYNKTEGINPNLPKAVDQDEYVKLYEVGDAIHLKKTLYYYRQHQNSISLGKNKNKAFYWQWKVASEAGERRNIDLSELFFNHFLIKKEYWWDIQAYNKLKKNTIFRLLKKLKLL